MMVPAIRSRRVQNSTYIYANLVNDWYVSDKIPTRTVLVFTLLSFLSAPVVVYSHGGGLNRQGCHNVRATGGYHCHRTSYTPPTTPRRRTNTAAPARQPTYRSVPSSSAQSRVPVQPLGSVQSVVPAPQIPAPPERPAMGNAGLSSDVVREAQGYLAYLGYKFGEIDGLIGPKTRASIAAYQRTRGIKPDGLVSNALLNRMASEISSGGTEDTAPTARSRLIERLQFYLGLLDLYGGPQNGIKTVALEQAIIRFQAANRISVDGLASEELLVKVKDAVL